MKNIFFDFDGTIANSQEGTIKALESMAETLGLTKLDTETYKKFIGPALTDSLAKFYPDFPASRYPEAIKVYQAYYNTKGLHQLVLKGIDDENAGKYRNHDVIISGAQHRPPQYIKVPELMEKLIMNYDEWDKYHPIVRSALLHGELVKIHPFIDGNGRTSRLIMNMELMRSGYVPVIIKKNNRLKYYEALDKAHTTGDYTDFVKLVTEAENEMLDRYLSVVE